MSPCWSALQTNTQRPVTCGRPASVASARLGGRARRADDQVGQTVGVEQIRVAGQGHHGVDAGLGREPRQRLAGGIHHLGLDAAPPRLGQSGIEHPDPHLHRSPDLGPGRIDLQHPPEIQDVTDADVGGQFWLDGVLLDDTDDRPGVKFADAELIGIPHRLVISERNLANGEFEYQHRRDTESRNLPRDEALNLLKAEAISP